MHFCCLVIVLWEMKLWFLHLNINAVSVVYEIKFPRKSKNIVFDTYQCVYLITAGTQPEGNPVPTGHCTTTAVSLWQFPPPARQEGGKDKYHWRVPAVPPSWWGVNQPCIECSLKDIRRTCWSAKLVICHFIAFREHLQWIPRDGGESAESLGACRRQAEGPW